MALQDIDLRYKGAALYTTRSVEVGGNLIVDGTTALVGAPLPIASGGTGSGIQNFVDLSAVQSVGGAKTFTANLVASATFAPTGGYATGYNPGPSAPQPADHGLLAWSYDPALLGPTTTSVATNGTLYLGAVYLRNPATISKVWWAQGTAGVTPTANQSFASVWNSAGTLMGSVNIDGKVAAANGPQNVALSVPASNAPAGLYWVGLQFQAATAPCLCRAQTPFTGFFATNLAAAGYRFATNGAALTALPASIAPSSNSLAGAVSIWAAVS